MCAGHLIQTVFIRDEPSPYSWTILSSRENSSSEFNMQLGWRTWLPTAFSTSFSTFLSPVSPLFPCSFDPIDLPQPKLLLTRLFLFINLVNLQHSFDPTSWQWSGNKLLRLNETPGNCVPTAPQKGKQLCLKVSQAKYFQIPRLHQRSKGRKMCLLLIKSQFLRM